MSLVLEMPVDAIEGGTVSIPFDEHDALVASQQTTAQAAADLIDQGEAEIDPDVIDGSFTVDETTGPTDVGGDLETTLDAVIADAEKPKKKRGRRKKGEQAAAEQQPETSDAAQPVAETDAAKDAVQTECSADSAQSQSPQGDAPAAPSSAKASNDNPQAADLLDEIARAESECDNAERGVLSLKEELKAAKKEYEAAVHKLRRLCRALENDSDRPLLHPSATGTTTPSGIMANDRDATGTTTEQTQPPANPDAWRTAPITELGLPPKLAETLIENNADTIGRLEDLRAEISQGRAKWPKGVGAAKITIIEDAVIKWLTANQETWGVKETGQPAATQLDTQLAVQSQSSDAPPAGGSAAVTSDSITPSVITVAAEQTDEEFAAEIAARAAAINNNTDGCLDRKHAAGDKFWQSGFEAYNHNFEMAECPYVPGDERDDWLRGYMAAKAVFELPDAKEVESAESPAAAVAPAPATADIYSFDDI